MAPRRRIIIDTDPGNDDVVALLLALAAPATELEVVLVSVVAGNVDVRACLRNAVATFHVVDKEIQWRKANGLPVGFDGVTKYKPIIAVGASEPLHDTEENADYFHGIDGLAGSTETHPQFNPDDSWRKLFEQPPLDSQPIQAAKQVTDISPPIERNFTPSTTPAHLEILRVLKENPPNTISIVAIGPLTNLALAAAHDPETFLLAKEVVAMGGVVDGLGNVTPNAEFNIWADPHAAARVFALTSQNPASTMPPFQDKYGSYTLAEYPSSLSTQLKMVLFALDITESHVVTRALFKTKASALAERGSPLAQWMSAFLLPLLDKMERLHHGQDGDAAALALHDPLCVYYVLTQDDPLWTASKTSPEDLRIETAGQWTRGMTVADRRPRRRRDSDGEAPHDRGNWLGRTSGNRVVRMLGSPGADDAGAWMLDRILGYVQ